MSIQKYVQGGLLTAKKVEKSMYSMLLFVQNKKVQIYAQMLVHASAISVRI